MIYSRRLRWRDIVKVLWSYVYVWSGRVVGIVGFRIFVFTVFVWSIVGWNCYGGFIWEMRNVRCNVRFIWWWLRYIVDIIIFRRIVRYVFFIFLSRRWSVIYSKFGYVVFGEVFYGGRSIIVYFYFWYGSINGIISIVSYRRDVVVVLWWRIKLENIFVSYRSYNL